MDGQVAGGFTRGGFRLMARRPGQAFGRARMFAASSLTPSGVVAAGNRRGDAVFAWESGYDDVYALVRRRSGKVVAICGRRGGFGAATSITGPPQTINEYPQVVVNASGRQ